MATDALALDLLAPVADPLGAYPYRGWETLYRDLYTYDYTARSTHSMNCTGSCTWKVYVKNNIAFKEEQYADYPAINSVLPTYNPRGLEGRKLHRVRLRPAAGEVSADPDRSSRRGQVAQGHLGRGPEPHRLEDHEQHLRQRPGLGLLLLGDPCQAFRHFRRRRASRTSSAAVMCSFYDWYCDLPPGEPITWGEQTDCCEAADWVNSEVPDPLGRRTCSRRAFPTRTS